MHCGAEVTESSTNKQHHLSRHGEQPMHGREYVLMCSCCGAGVLRAAVKVIPEFVYSKASACACVKSERFQVRDGQPQLLAVPRCPVLHHLLFVEVH